MSESRIIVVQAIIILCGNTLKFGSLVGYPNLKFVECVNMTYQEDGYIYFCDCVVSEGLYSGKRVQSLIFGCNRFPDQISRHTSSVDIKIKYKGGVIKCVEILGKTFTREESEF